MTTEHLSIKTSVNENLSEFEPHSCLFDTNCNYLRLELRKRSKTNTFKEITGYSEAEDYLVVTIFGITLLPIGCAIKLRNVMRQRDMAYRFAFRNQANNPFNETTLCPPPYPDPV